MAVPVIDMSAWLADPAAPPSASSVAAMREACEAGGSSGFFAVVGHGLDQEVEAAMQASKVFFARTGREHRDAILAGTDPYGYFPMESEALGYEANVDKKPDLREAFSMGPIGGPSARLAKAAGASSAGALSEVVDFCYHPTPWPAKIGPGAGGVSDAHEFRRALESFYTSSSRLGRGLLQLVAAALDLPLMHFDKASAPGEHANSARAIWYPRIPVTRPPAPGQERCGAHSDTGALTLLWPDGPGLEIQPPPGAQLRAGADIGDIDGGGDGRGGWVPVEVPPGAVIVNVGDLLERVSGGRKWRSTPHRVRAPRGDRLLDPATNRDRLVLVLFLILAADFPIDATTTQGSYLYEHFTRWGRNAKL